MGNSKKIKISACLVIYNEEEVLDRCLSSIKEVVDEIIIVHDGECTDKSLKIAKKYNAKIFIKEHVGESQYHRPFAFSISTGDWVLHIDADEYLGDELKKEIPNLVKIKKFDAFAFKWPVWLPFKSRFVLNGPYSKMVRPILFRKENLYMIGVPHFHPATNGRLSKNLNFTLDHKPKSYSFSISGLKKKIIPWARLKSDYILRQGSCPRYGHIPIKVENWYSRSGLLLFLEIPRRVLWFIRNGGLYSEPVNLKIFLYDLTGNILTFYFYFFRSLSRNPSYVVWFGDAESSARYSVVSRWVKKNKPLNVLDVGGGWRTIYPELESQVNSGSINITSVDVNFEDKKIFDKISYTQTSPGQRLPFKDKSFDLVFSLDAFEHIPAKQREFFIKEISRVSKKDLILSFPTGEQSQNLDKELYDFSKKHSSEIHRFFIEHIDNGLPDISDYFKLINTAGLSLVNEKPLHSIFFRRLVMKLWILNPKVYKLFSPLILVLYKTLGFGDCYRRYYFFTRI